jgi:putative lipoic acid-binding regulatory protein
MNEPVQRAPNRDLLLATHNFPGPYLIKVFGPPTPEFRQQLDSALAQSLMQAAPQTSEKISAKGSTLCISLHLHVETVDEVIDVYEQIFARVRGLKLIF